MSDQEYFREGCQHDEQWSEVRRELTAMHESLRALHRKVDLMAGTEQDLQNDLDAIKAGVADVATKLAAQAQTISDLQAQIAAGTPVSQAQLDGLKTEADGIVTALAALNPPPAPPTA